MSAFGKLLLDTDILSLYLKKNPKVVTAAQNYLRDHTVFSFSVITRFEILRGLKTKIAAVQLNAFNMFCRNNEIIELNDKIIVCAADIYAELHKSGQIIGDADILIAATAIVGNLGIVTNNEHHFNRISNLQIVNWNK